MRGVLRQQTPAAMASLCRRLRPSASLALPRAAGSVGRVATHHRLPLAREQPAGRRVCAGAAARWVSDRAASAPTTDSSSCTFVNLADGFSKFSDHWSPKVVGEVNGMAVKIVKLEGEFDWQCVHALCSARV